MLEALAVGILLALAVLGVAVVGTALAALAKAVWQDVKRWGSRT